jgi:hypothetical protein
MTTNVVHSAYQWYTRVVGVYFALIIIPLILDYNEFGFRPETMHKVFHILVGAAVLRWGWNDARWWKPFTITTASFFSFVTMFGWLFPNFGMPVLEAFGLNDTLLHAAVALSGIIVTFAASHREHVAHD